MIKPIWLIVYSGVDSGVDSDRDRGGRVGSGNCYSESIDPVSDLLLDSYSKLDVFLCKG